MSKYPFTPEYLDALPEELAELFRALEDTLLTEICTRLNHAGELNEVTVQDIRALRSHGISLDEITKAISTTTNTGEQKMKDLLQDVVDRNQAYYIELIDLADITAPETLVDAATIEAITAQAMDEYRNITRSLGFLVDGGRTKLDPANAYQWVLDKATLKIQSGAISYNQAIESAVRELADSGIRTVNYESGHTDHADVAARRAVMTGVNQLCQQYANQATDYLETDLVQVSAHIGARNIDGPLGWENHERWQGKIYRWAAKKQTSTGDYPDFVKSCGYGDVTGIEGANCRHHWSPHIEGVMEPTYTEAELNAMKGANRVITYEGREYDGYQATQKQREIERTIRLWKRRKTSYEAAGLTEQATAATARLRRLNTEYRSFSEAAGLRTQLERLKVLDGDA